MSSHDDALSLGSIEALEARLQRIEHYLLGTAAVHHGEANECPADQGPTVYMRLSKLEQSLQKLSSNSRAASNILQLHKNHVELFPSVGLGGLPGSYSTTEQLAIVNSCATLFPTAASRLNSLRDSSIPPSESLASLVALEARLSKAELDRDTHNKDLSHLRLRTALALQRWYGIGVIAGGDCWAEWEKRLLEVEKVVRREEMLLFA